MIGAGALFEQPAMTGGVETNLAELLLTAAHEYPDKVCIETVSGSWTFEQVASMAGCIRVVLQQALLRAQKSSEQMLSNHVEPPAHGRRDDEHVVTVALERGVEALAAVHAIMLERCAYNCFDVAEHKEKLFSWVEVAQPPVMLSSRATLAKLGLQDGSIGPCSPIIVDVHSAIQKVGSRSEQVRSMLQPAHRQADLDRLAYLIFTSGSTGKPKAVMIQHKSALNVVRIWSKHVGLGHQDRFAQVASMSWDVHIIEVYGNLCARSSIINVPDHIKKSGPDMLEFLKQSQITGMSVVPSHLRMISNGGKEDVSCSPAGLPHLRILDVGGEALGQDVVQSWVPGRSMYNSYGPSEISVVCTCATVRVGDEITIGHDLPTYACHVLDPETLKPVARGERGVLFIGGVGLARGYLNEAEKTAAKFVEIEGLGRLYNSGDLVSRDELNRIHFHGRVDWQVKVRGIRIELEALEQEISGLAEVKHCEARVVDDGQKLVLIVSGNESLSEATLKETAASLGKGYVLSLVHIVAHSAWKFNTSGKLVRNHVQLQLESQSQSAQHDGWKTFEKSSASDLELDIAMCMAPKVTASSWTKQSHFLEDLGIDSTGFAQMVSQFHTRAEFRCVNLLMLFQHPTVEKLAKRVAELASHDEDSDVEWSEFDQGAAGLVDSFLANAKRSPHVSCVEEEACSFTYAQILQCALAVQRLLRKSLTQIARDEVQPTVALVLHAGSQLVAGCLASFLEGCSICVLDPGSKRSDLVARLNLVQPVSIFSDPDTVTTLELADICDGLPKTCALVDVSVAMHSSQKLRRLRPRQAYQGLCCITFSESCNQKLLALKTDHTSAFDAVREWRNLTQVNAGDRCLTVFHPSSAAGNLGMWCALHAGATMLSPAGRGSRRSPQHWLFQKRATHLGCNASFLEDIDRNRDTTLNETTANALKLVWVLNRPGSETSWPEMRWAASSSLQRVSVFCLPEAWVLANSKSAYQPKFHGFENFHLHILDAKLEPAKPGMPGTLFVSGAGVAQGYLGDAEENNSHFVNTPTLGVLFNTGYVVTKDGNGVEIVNAPRPLAQRALTGILRGSMSTVGRTFSSLRSFIYHPERKASQVSTPTYGQDSYPVLCRVVQGTFIISEPILAAAKLLLADRVLLPVGLSLVDLGMLQVFVIILLLLAVQKLTNVLGLVAAKWLLIGRYREGDHDIYSLFYLRHWIVQRMAQGTPVATAGNFGVGVGANFLKNLLLKALGADVAMSAVVMAPTVAFDLIRVGEMATVHGPNQLTAASYGTGRMRLAAVQVGEGAYVGPRSVLEPGCKVMAGAYVEALSTVSAGEEIEGHVNGVPARPVQHEATRKMEGQSRDNLKFICGSLPYVALDWINLVPKAVSPFVGLMLLRAMAGGQTPSAVLQTLDEEFSFHQKVLHVDMNEFPIALLEIIWWLPLFAVFASIMTTLGTIASTVIICRVLPKMRPPLDIHFTSIRARIIAMKTSMATQLSNMLTDASMQAACIRLCGAEIGQGTLMAEQQFLPDSLTVGEGCFFASGNVLTSLNVDQGRMLLPCRTVMDDRSFMGNHNHIVEGLTEGSFAGLNTWMPKKPLEPNMSFFGNPAMPFKRLGTQQAPPKPSALMQFWFHFSSSVIDVFFWKALKGAVTVLPFCVGRCLFPSIDAAWQVACLFCIYVSIPVLAWYVVAVRIGNALHSEHVAAENEMYSFAVTRWFNSQNVVRAFPNPIKVAGTGWQASFLGLFGAQIGKNFFAPVENVLWDPCHARIGDGVIADYDATVKNHTFADFKLKFVDHRICDGARLMQGSALSSTGVSNGAVLRPGSSTWKGQTLEAHTVYEGAPAEPVSPDLEAGLAEADIAPPVLLGRKGQKMPRDSKLK